MMKNLVGAIVLTASLLVAGGTTVLAQQHHLASVSVPDATHSPDTAEAGLATIFTNFGPKKDTYDGTGGWIAAGPQDTYTNQQQDVAIPFTPSSNATVTRIKVPFQYYGYGKNAGTIALASDASGLPGAVLATRDLKNLPVFGIGCCKMTVWILKTGVQVTAGTQYWIVATTDKKSIDSAYVWDYTWDGELETVALQDNLGGWGTVTFLPGPAATVLGTVQ
jgi:hypothetical protein